jgi:hypothetical protein
MTGPRRRHDVRAVLEALGIRATEGAGGRLEARCPYHADRGSKLDWFVNAEGERAGLHLCRVCGAKGALAGLVMHVRGYLAFSSALDFLAPFEVTGAGPLPATVRVEVRRAAEMREPGEVCWDPLGEWVAGARGYALSRGLTARQVERWGIGYAVDGRLGGRVVFPMRSPAGALLGYHARLFAGDGPRYLTPRAEDGADPGAMFGELRWPPPRERRHWRVVVWEGAVKALAFERALPGEPFGVLGGSHGRALHVAKLATFPEVVLATDGNAAGDAAAVELGAQLRRHVKVSRVRFTRDPDEMTPGEVRDGFR